VLDWGFESGELGVWTKEGTAFDNQPIFGDNPTARRRPGHDEHSNHVGNYWIGTYEDYHGLTSETPGSIQGDLPTGIITSPVFTIDTGEVSFLVGGGNFGGTPGDYSRGTFVALVALNDDGSTTEIFRQPGYNREKMRRRSFDISTYMGSRAVVKIVDMETGDWGHINCDDFRWKH
jgi:hypothetical protein